jgi:hypothetical protein
MKMKTEMRKVGKGLWINEGNFHDEDLIGPEIF